MNSLMLPQYNTVLFSNVWDNAEDFVEDYKTIGIPTIISDESANTLFYLLYARYANNPIANNDLHQWKMKMFSVIFQYGPTWEKRLEIQDKLRGIPEEELLRGSKAIHNHAFNPSSAPSTASIEELDYINDQNTSHYKKSQMDAYMQLWELLRVDVTEVFLTEFKKCFKIFVDPELPLLYITETDEQEDE